MAASRTITGNPLRQTLISVALAAVLVTLTTLFRAVLSPHLGVLSPFMLYVAAVLAAGLMRGALCGLLVMIAGGAVAMRLFLVNDGATVPGAWMSLFLFWAVSGLVLATANELRVQLTVAMRRLSAVLQQDGRARS
jgi:K+-sensing histidine kinase KdpD